MALKDVSKSQGAGKAIAGTQPTQEPTPVTVVSAPVAGLTAAQITATKAAAQAKAKARTAFVAETVVVEYQQAMTEAMVQVADAMDQIDQFFFGALVGCAQEAYAPQLNIASAEAVALPEGK
jgi:hypothetical protein